MTSSIAEFARLVSASSNQRVAFEATQVTESNGLRIEANVCRYGSRSIHVEYQTYQSAWTELEEALSGQVEFNGDELCGFHIHCQGQVTWVYDPSTNMAIRKMGAQLFEPIPGVATLGQLAFLDTLPQDFLLRDLGEEPIDERTVRRIGLKPKQLYRSMLLSAVSFPITRATIGIDTETLFPASISLTPSVESPAASIVGPDAVINITYKDVRFLETPKHSFAPPNDAHIFRESRLSIHELADSAPFPMSLNPILDGGFEAADRFGLLTMDEQGERGYATVYFSTAGHDEDADTPSPRLTLCVGNYMSRNMARRRITFAEMGREPAEASLPVKLLDRSELWEQRLPGVDTEHAPVEAFFDKDGTFWFLSGTGIGLDFMETLACDLLEAGDDQTS